MIFYYTKNRNLAYNYNYIKLLMIFSIIFNLFITIKINLLIVFLKFKKKKIIFFYHPRKNLTLMHTYYIEYIFRNYSKEYYIIYGHEAESKINKNYIYIKQGYLRFLFLIDVFVSNNICDKFPNNCQKIYIHHNLYDDPWVPRNMEKEMCQRLLKYNFIFVGTGDSVTRVNDMFVRYKFNFRPIIKEVGYAKLDYLLNHSKENQKKKDSILIAPTGIDGFPELSIIAKIEKIIDNLLVETNFLIILRPHPRDRTNKKYLYLKEKYNNNDRFSFDISENYFHTYSRSKLMITDMSGTAYTFAFLILSPVIFLSTNEKKIGENEYTNYSFYLDRNKIGKVIFDEKEILNTVRLIFKDYPLYEKNIFKIRSRMKYLNKSKIEIKNFIEKLNR